MVDVIKYDKLSFDINIYENLKKQSNVYFVQLLDGNPLLLQIL